MTNRLQIIKKDGTLEQYDEQKIINACNKAARRAMATLTDEDCQIIRKSLVFGLDEVDDLCKAIYKKDGVI